MLKKPVLKLQKITEGKWFFLNYNNPQMANIEKRMIIVKEEREDGPWWGIEYIFPILNERGILGEIERLNLAKKAIRYLKALEKDIL